jgi:maltooligosyltrehalose trehalohydrolase
LNHQLDRDRFACASTLLLYLPYTPMLFMGQEFGASSPFQFFTDHNPELGRLVTEGRRKEFQAFSAFADAVARERIPDPQADSTFQRSKLRLAQADEPPGSDLQAVYRRLIGLRKNDPVLQVQDRRRTQARALGADVLAVRRWRDDQQRLLLVNFGDRDARVETYGGGWCVLFDSGQATCADLTGVTVHARGATILARDGG